MGRIVPRMTAFKSSLLTKGENDLILSRWPRKSALREMAMAGWVKRFGVVPEGKPHAGKMCYMITDAGMAANREFKANAKERRRFAIQITLSLLAVLVPFAVWLLQFLVSK